MIATFEEFCQVNCGMERINKSHLILLPKSQGADRVEDFWPISLSNSIYPIMENVLGNMLCEVIDELVGPFQSAFILGRQLVDNTVVAGEIVAAWGRKDTKGFIWKVNFAKAYDSLDLAFSWSSMRRRGFPLEWITWVRRCITSHSFFRLSKWASKVGVDSTPKGSEIGLSTSTLSICLTSGCTCHVYASNMFAWHA